MGTLFFSFRKKKRSKRKPLIGHCIDHSCMQMPQAFAKGFDPIFFKRLAAGGRLGTLFFSFRKKKRSKRKPLMGCCIDHFCPQMPQA